MEKSYQGKTLHPVQTGSPPKAEKFLSKGHKAYKAHVESENQTAFTTRKNTNKKDMVT